MNTDMTSAEQKQHQRDYAQSTLGSFLDLTGFSVKQVSKIMGHDAAYLHNCLKGKSVWRQADAAHLCLIYEYLEDDSDLTLEVSDALLMLKETKAEFYDYWREKTQ